MVEVRTMHVTCRKNSAYGTWRAGITCATRSSPTAFISSLHLLIILFAFLFQVVLASVFGFYLPVRPGRTFWAKNIY
jgi:hypothetical protein